ncbi:MAG: class I SAM-dependent methyltransferase [Candidatus Brocadia sp.]
MQALSDLIIEKIKKEGKITFAEFMQMALYHPQYGYYNSDTERIGKFGDYYTSPTVHRMFGELIAKQLDEMWRIMGKEVFTVVEMGANRGWLCHDIVQCVKKEYPEFYDRLHYIIVESNPYAQKKQQLFMDSIDVPYENTSPSSSPYEGGGREGVFDYNPSFILPSQVGNKGALNQKACRTPACKEVVKNLFSDGTDGKVSWHAYTEDGFSFGKIQGCVLSNEYVDALPVHRLKIKNKILKEVYVGYNATDFCEIDDEISSPALQDYLETNKIYLKEGQEYEVNLDAAKWLRHVSEKLEKGFIITIDYGDTIDGIYRESNTGGTVRCYHKHTVNRDYYERLGEQDITAHVDFTNLMNAGRPLGLETTGFTKQSHYLIALGILERLNNVNNDIDTILKVKNLLHPEEMGEIFKVLVQHKNIENPQLISLRPLRTITM